MDALTFFLFVLLWWSRIHESTGKFPPSARRPPAASFGLLAKVAPWLRAVWAERALC